MTINKNIDFEVIKERWGKYNLDDGSVLKIKFVFINIKTFDQNGKKQYSANIQNHQTVNCPEHLIGEPSKEIHSYELLQKNMEKDNVSVNLLEIPVNEYILDDGTKLKASPQVIKVSRSSLKNDLGEPIYLVTTNLTINYNVLKPIEV